MSYLYFSKKDSKLQTNLSAADTPNYKFKLTLGIKPFRQFDHLTDLSRLYIAQILISTAVATPIYITITNFQNIFSFLSEPLERSDFK